MQQPADERHRSRNPEPRGREPLPGASWQITYTGNSGFLNNVEPNFTAVALEDLWNPSDKLNIDLGLRDEDYEYDLANTTNDGQNFWFLAGQREFCYNPVTLAPYFIPAPPASGKPPTPFVGFNCPIDHSIPAHPVQTVHPDGKDGHLLLSNNYPPSALRLRVHAAHRRDVYGQSRHGAALLRRPLRARARDLSGAVQRQG